MSTRFMVPESAEGCLCCVCLGFGLFSLFRVCKQLFQVMKSPCKLSPLSILKNPFDPFKSMRKHVYIMISIMFMYQHSSTVLLYQQYIGCKQTILFEKFMMQIWFFYNQYLSSQQTASLKLLDISSQFFFG